MVNRMGPERNQSKTLPLIPNDDSSVWSKRWWSIVSNAALRSSRTSIAPHECRLPEGGHFEHVGELSQCCAVDDMLIERLHTDGELSDDLQAAHIQCVLQVWIRKKGSKQAESSLKFRNQVWPFLWVVKRRLSSILGRNRQTPERCWQQAWAQVLAHLDRA